MADISRGNISLMLPFVTKTLIPLFGAEKNLQGFVAVQYCGFVFD